MPVDSKHAEYVEQEKDWVLVSDLLKGERRLKDVGTRYIPRLSGQNSQEYASYIIRGSYFSAYPRTIEAMSGVILRKNSIVDVPESMKDKLKSITVERKSYEEIEKTVVDEITSYGRIGLLVDIADDAETVYIAEYDTFSILNWDKEMINGKEVYNFIALHEVRNEVLNDDYFQMKETRYIRILQLDEQGYYFVMLYRQKLDLSPEEKKRAGKQDVWESIPVYSGSGQTKVYPTIRGERLTYIPFICINSKSVDISPRKPPMLDLANLNIAHWRLSVDYHYGLHLCALPTPYAIGFEAKDKWPLGPTAVWHTTNDKAKCGFTEFSGQGLTQLREALKEKRQEMAAVGSRIIAEERKGVEAAETARIRQSGESSVLSSIALNISTGMTRVLRYMARWLSYSDEEITKIRVQLNTDFIAEMIDNQMIESLLKARQANEISQDTFLYNLQKGEVLPKERSIQDEKDLISVQSTSDLVFNDNTE